MAVCTRACRGQRSATEVIPQDLSTLLLRQALSLCSLSSPHRAGVTRVCHRVSFVIWLLGTSLSNPHAYVASASLMELLLQLHLPFPVFTERLAWGTFQTPCFPTQSIATGLVLNNPEEGNPDPTLTTEKAKVFKPLSKSNYQTFQIVRPNPNSGNSSKHC